MSKILSPNINKISSFLLDIFYPKKCLSCGKHGDFLCLSCASEIENIKTSTCPKCGKISENGRYCPSCRSNRKAIFANGIIVAAHYNSGPTKELIYNFKYLGFTLLAPIFAELICQQIESKFKPDKTVVVPVPLNLRRKNSRGYNQSELIARALSDRLSLPGGDALLRIRDTKSQVGLSREQRLENLLDAFSCQDQELVLDKIVLLVDDVTTTGATLNQCAKALKLAGAKEVWGVVVARNI